MEPSKPSTSSLRYAHSSLRNGILARRFKANSQMIMAKSPLTEVNMLAPASSQLPLVLPPQVPLMGGAVATTRPAFAEFQNSSPAGKIEWPPELHNTIWLCNH